MTVIAWDGKTLAADRMSSCFELIEPVTKIWRLKDGSLIGAAGSATRCLAMMDWIEKGADPAAIPPFQMTDDWVHVLRVMPDKTLLRYENGAFPLKVEAEKTAIGSGRDFAIAAMHLGLGAVEAVELANKLSSSCGCGVNMLHLI